MLSRFVPFSYKINHYFFQSLDLGEVFWETLSLSSISILVALLTDCKAHSNSLFPCGCIRWHSGTRKRAVGAPGKWCAGRS